MIEWLNTEGSEKDVVVSSKIKLARNFEDKKFSQMLSVSEADELIHRVKTTVLSEKFNLGKKFEFYRLNNMSQIEREVLVENHLISETLNEKFERSGFLISETQDVTIMINEENHITIQTLSSGLNLNKGWDICNKGDDLMEGSIKYAFDEKLGYLTSSLENIGTGMKVSIMLHLPALVSTGHINKVLQGVTQIGVIVKGMYGENINTVGNLFQISNQTTLGETEEEIIEKLNNVSMQLIGKERNMRNKLVMGKKIEIEDKIYRSLSILRSSRIISSKEAMRLLSDVKMGVSMNMIDEVDHNLINNLMINVQPANIQKYADKILSSKQKDIKRAELLRNSL